MGNSIADLNIGSNLSANNTNKVTSNSPCPKISIKILYSNSINIMSSRQMKLIVKRRLIKRVSKLRISQLAKFKGSCIRYLKTIVITNELSYYMHKDPHITFASNNEKTIEDLISFLSTKNKIQKFELCIENSQICSIQVYPLIHFVSNFKQLKSLSILLTKANEAIEESTCFIPLFSIKKLKNLNFFRIASDNGSLIKRLSLTSLIIGLSKLRKLNSIHLDLSELILDLDKECELEQTISKLKNIKSLKLELFTRYDYSLNNYKILSSSINSLSNLEELTLVEPESNILDFHFQIFIENLKNLQKINCLRIVSFHNVNKSIKILSDTVQFMPQLNSLYVDFGVEANSTFSKQFADTLRGLQNLRKLSLGSPRANQTPIFEILNHLYNNTEKIENENRVELEELSKLFFFFDLIN